MTKQTRNMQVLSLRWLYSKILHYLFFNLTILNQYLSITDLPPKTKLTNLGKLADLDMKKLPHPEESGDRCIRRIQEFLINEMSSAEWRSSRGQTSMTSGGSKYFRFLSATFLQTRVWLFVASIQSQT